MSAILAGILLVVASPGFTSPVPVPAGSGGPGAGAGRPLRATVPGILRVADGGSGADSPKLSAEGLFARVLGRNRGVRDFRADFRQTLEPRALAAPPSETGRVFYKSPRLMRWEYESPERKLAVSDGSTGWLELPDERRVIRVDLQKSFGSGPVSALLSGGVEALGEFSVEYLPSEEGVTALRLVPRKPVDDFDSIELRVSAESLAIQAVDIVDPGGNRMTYRFGDLAENVGLPAALFEYEPPDDFEVVGP